MPVVKSSPSDPVSQNQNLRSVRDAGLGQVRRLKRIYKTKASPQRAAVTIGIASGLAVLFPLPFTIAGVLAAVDDALNLGDDAAELKVFLKEAVETLNKEQAPKKAKKSKKTNGPVGAPAPAAG